VRDTREGKVDQVARPSLIRKVVDPKAEFLFVPANDVKHVASAKAVP
jgi:hypothetical protein